MFQFAVTAALEELPLTQPVVLRGTIEEVCKTAKKYGYDAIELHIREPKRYHASVIRKTASDYGLAIAAVATGMEYTVGGLSLIDDDIVKREAALNRVYEHADFCAALSPGSASGNKSGPSSGNYPGASLENFPGTRLIVGIMRGNVPKNGNVNVYSSIFSQNLGKICDYAEKIKVPVVVESIIRYINNYFCGVGETMDFITAQNRKNLSLHIDTHHMVVEERNIRESLLYCKNKPLGYVHYSDNNRLYPGGGAIDFKELTRTLVEIGYGGTISVECLPWPSQEECAQRAIINMKNYLKEVS